MRRSSPLSLNVVSTSLVAGAVNNISNVIQSMNKPHCFKLPSKATSASSKHNIFAGGCHPPILQSTSRKPWNDVIRIPVNGYLTMLNIIPGEECQVLSSGYMVRLAVARPFLLQLSYNKSDQKGVWLPVTTLTSMVETPEISVKCCALYSPSSLLSILRHDKSCKRYITNVIWVPDNQLQDNFLSNSRRS